MKQPSLRSSLIKILPLFVCCFLFITPVYAQQKNNSEKSLANLYNEFKEIEKLPCGQRYQAVRIGRSILEKHDKDLNGEWGRIFKLRFSALEIEEIKCPGNSDKKSLTDLYADFMTARGFSCGNRIDAVRIGKEIIEKFGNDEIDYDLVLDVKKQIPFIEEKDRTCKSDADKEISELWENFKTAKKMPCGKRDEAFRIGKFIIAAYEVDAHFRKYTDFIKKRLAEIEEEEKNCKIVN